MTAKPQELDLAQFDGHADGPWEAEVNNPDWDGSVRAASGLIVCVPEQHCDSASANSALIAAAPALLAECRSLRASEARLRAAGERCLAALRANGAPNCEAAKEMTAALSGDAS